MTSFYCIHCGGVFDGADISTPMKDSPGWVWMRDDCPRCHKGLDNWYRSLGGVTRYTHVLVGASKNAIRHNHVRRRGKYVGHWRMIG